MWTRQYVWNKDKKNPVHLYYSSNALIIFGFYLLDPMDICAQQGNI